MEKTPKYTQVYEPTLQAIAMTIAWQNGIRTTLDTPLKSVCYKVDRIALVLDFEEKLDMEINDEQSIETLNDIVELIRIQFSDEELRERINDYFAQCWLSDDDDDEPVNFDPELAEIEDQRTTEIMNFLRSPQSAENPEGIDDILAKYDAILAEYKKQ